MIQTTFFSYKGGSGRTTTLFNTLPFLAKELNATKDNPIVIFDMDYRSAGITILFNKQEIYKVESDDDPIDIEGKKRSIQYLLEKEDVAVDDLKDFKRKFAEPVGHIIGLEDNDSVLIVGANLDLKNNEPDRKKAGVAIRAYAEFLAEEGVSCIVYDSPSGTQISAEVSVANSKVIVCCMRPSYQFRETTLDYLDSFIEDYYYTTKKSVVLLTTAVPQKDISVGGEYQISKAYVDIIQRINFFNAVAFDNNPKRLATNPIIDTAMIEEENMGIPEIERFKWSEKFPLYYIKTNNIEPLTKIEEYALERYSLLAKVIVSKANI